MAEGGCILYCIYRIYLNTGNRGRSFCLYQKKTLTRSDRARGARAVRCVCDRLLSLGPMVRGFYSRGSVFAPERQIK